MSAPLQVGTPVRVLAPWSGSETEPSEPTTIAAVQFIDADGEIVDGPTADWQYVLDGDEPFADCAFRPEYVGPA
jgi:hypothetical protein